MVGNELSRIFFKIDAKEKKYKVALTFCELMKDVLQTSKKGTMLTGSAQIPPWVKYCGISSLSLSEFSIKLFRLGRTSGEGRYEIYPCNFLILIDSIRLPILNHDFIYVPHLLTA